MTPGQRNKSNDRSVEFCIDSVFLNAVLLSTEKIALVSKGVTHVDSLVSTDKSGTVEHSVRSSFLSRPTIHRNVTPF